MRALLDGLHEDLNRNTSKPKYVELLGDVNASSKTDMQYKNEISKIVNFSLGSKL